MPQLARSSVGLAGRMTRAGVVADGPTIARPGPYGARRRPRGGRRPRGRGDPCLGHGRSCYGWVHERASAQSEGDRSAPVPGRRGRARRGRLALGAAGARGESGAEAFRLPVPPRRRVRRSDARRLRDLDATRPRSVPGRRHAGRAGRRRVGGGERREDDAVSCGRASRWPGPRKAMPPRGAPRPRAGALVLVPLPGRAARRAASAARGPPPRGRAARPVPLRVRVLPALGAGLLLVLPAHARRRPGPGHPPWRLHLRGLVVGRRGAPARGAGARDARASTANRHALYKTDPDLQAAHARYPWVGHVGRPRGGQRLRDRPGAEPRGPAGLPPAPGRRLSGLLGAHAAAPHGDAPRPCHAPLPPAHVRRPRRAQRGGRAAVPLDPALQRGAARRGAPHRGLRGAHRPRARPCSARPGALAPPRARAITGALERHRPAAAHGRVPTEERGRAPRPLERRLGRLRGRPRPPSRQIAAQRSRTRWSSAATSTRSGSRI